MRRTTVTAAARALLATVLPVLLIAGSATGASAAGTPDGCTSEALHVDFASDPSSNDVFHVHRVGDQLQIGVDVANDAAGACTIDDATVTVQVPNADGTPGPVTTIATHASFPGGMAKTELATKAPYTVAFDPAVFRGRVTIAYSGTGHFPAGDAPAAGSTATNVVVSKPHATLTVTPSTASGPAPLAVTYTYRLTNDSAVDPDSPTTTPIIDSSTPQLDPDGSFLSDDTCSPIAYTGGDTHPTNPAQIDPGETWTFTCTHLFGDQGTFTDHASVAGFSSRDGRPWPTTIATGTVSALAPDLTIASSHSGVFTEGDHGRSYVLTATNAGNAPTAAVVKVADALPDGLAATAISGSGWTCDLPSRSCTRSDALAAGASYSPVTVVTDVAPDSRGAVTNAANVSGGGELDVLNDTALDPTAIAPAPTPATPPATTGGAPTGGSGPTATTATAATTTTTTGHAPPSNRFAIRRVKITRHGTAVFTLTAPDAGTFTLTGRATRLATRSARAATTAGGTVTLTLRPSAKARRALARAHRLRVRVTITFTPAGGAPSTRHASVTLVAPRRPGAR